MLQQGLILDDTYELTALVGSGGMGSVWRARHLRLPKTVAVKVLKVSDLDQEIYARFRREAEIASRLGHPNIVEALDFNTLPDGTPYLVLEYLRGQSLRDRLRQGPSTLETTVLVARQVAAALAAAARQGIVHRDIKPENIFLCEHEGHDEIHAKLLDFGISKIRQAETALTREGTIFGTPLYMSPEQASGQTADGRSDQYGLAIVVYEMLGGRPPFVGDDPLQVLYQVINEEPPPLGQLNKALPAAVIEVIARAMAKDPTSRFDDVASFAVALTGASGLPTPILKDGLTPMPDNSAPTVVASSQALQGDPLAATVASPVPIAPTHAGQAAEAVPSRRPLVIGVVALLLGVVVTVIAVASWRAANAPALQPVATSAPRDASTLHRPTVPDGSLLRDATDLTLATPPARLDAPHRPQPSRPPTARLPKKLAKLLRQAEKALAGGSFARARELGEHLTRLLPERHMWRAHSVLARAKCADHNLGGMQGSLLRVKPAGERAKVKRFCRAFIDM